MVLAVVLIALTGGIGSGKTYVCKIFEKFNIPVIYADQIVKHLLINDQLLIQKLNNYFKLDFNKNLKRLKLEIFKQSKDRLFVEKLIHPKVIEQILLKTKSLNKKCVLVEIPLIHNLFNILKALNINKIILTNCDLNLQISRLMHRDKLSKQNIMLIIKSQLPVEKAHKIADYILNTDDCNSSSDSLYYEINNIVNNGFFLN
ncbi:MAG: dephospho-CoA kinase [Gammaproteobacteria bacterium]